MASIETDSKVKDDLKNPSPKKLIKKIKQKKKSKKTKSEKQYKNLKELLDDINQEKNIKQIKKEKTDEIPKKDFFTVYRKSVSGTTVDSLSQEGNDVFTKQNSSVELKLKSNYILKNYYEINEEEESLYGKIIIFTPLFEYYKGFDEFLKKEYNDENTIDLSKSKNFIKKGNRIINRNKEKIEIKEKKEINNNINYNNSKMENKFNIDFNISANDSSIKIPIYNFVDLYNYDYDYNSNKNNDIQNIINNINININKKYYTYPFNKKQKKKKGKKIIENTSKNRKGDWTCQYCFNLNFSFRKLCNRCNALKQS